MKDGYLEAATSGQNITNTQNVRPASDQSYYDDRGNRIAIVQHTQANGGQLQDDVRVFAYDGYGQIIERRDGTAAGDVFSQASNTTHENQHYVYVNGQQVARYDEGGTLDVIDQVTAFDNSGAGTSGYIVQAGDSLRSIAQAVYGNASYWYIIAQANALTSDNDLAIGQNLSIPQVTTTANTATTFKPYNPSDIAGSTTPNLPTIAPPPVPPAHHCNIVAAIVAIAVIVVATILTAGALAPAAAGAGASLFSAGAAVLSGAAGLSAATVATAFAAGVAGNLAGQVVGDALGTHSGISLGEAFVGGFTTAATAGLGAELSPGAGLSNAFVGAKGLTALGGAVEGAGAYAGNVVGSHLVGQKSQFSWAGLVAAAVSGGAVAGLRVTPVGQQVGQTTGSFAGDVGAGLLRGEINSEVSRSLGDKRGTGFDSVVESAVGTAIGNSLAEHLGNTPVSEETRRNPSDLADAGTGAGASDGFGEDIAPMKTNDSSLAYFDGRTSHDPLDEWTRPYSTDGQVLRGWNSGGSLTSISESPVTDLAPVIVNFSALQGNVDIRQVPIFARMLPSMIRQFHRDVMVASDRPPPPVQLDLGAFQRRSDFRFNGAGAMRPVPVDDLRSSVAQDAISISSDFTVDRDSSSPIPYVDALGDAVRVGGSLVGAAETIVGGVVGLGMLAVTAVESNWERIVGTGGVTDKVFGVHTTAFDGSAERLENVGRSIGTFVAHPIDGLTAYGRTIDAHLQHASSLSQNASYQDQFSAGRETGSATTEVVLAADGAAGLARGAGRLASRAAFSSSLARSVSEELVDSTIMPSDSLVEAPVEAQRILNDGTSPVLPESTQEGLVKALSPRAPEPEAPGHVEEETPEYKAEPEVVDPRKFLSQHGVVDPLLQDQLIKGGLRIDLLSADKTPLTMKRFTKLFVETVNAGKAFKGRLGNIATRIETINKAAEFELADFTPNFEVRVKLPNGRSRYVDLVGVNEETGARQYVQFVKENQAGRIIRNDENTAVEEIERALNLPRNDVQKVRTNKELRDGQ